MAVRDRLVAVQEALLSSYRCRYGADTELVPGGCDGGRPAPQPPAEPGRSETPVYLCAGPGADAARLLAETVARLDAEAAPFFARESSGAARASFAAAGTADPDSPEGCAAAAAASGSRRILVLDDPAAPGRPGGWPAHARSGAAALQPAARSLAAALYGLAADPGGEGCETAEQWPLMGAGGLCGAEAAPRPLAVYRIGCADRAGLGWPCDDQCGRPAPLDGGGMLGSQAWEAYEGAAGRATHIGRPWRAGVSSRAAGGESLHFACFRDDGQWRFRAFVDWGRFTTSSIAVYPLRLVFSDGSETAPDAFSGSAFSSTFVFSDEDAASLAETVPASAAESPEASFFVAFGGYRIAAPFDLSGAGVVVRSALDACPAPGDRP